MHFLTLVESLFFSHLIFGLTSTWSRAGSSIDPLGQPPMAVRPPDHEGHIALYSFFPPPLGGRTGQ